MNADGTDVRRLTHATGYDGGPFFSPNGQQIGWRRFSEDGATAEIYTMNLDGSQQREITHLGAMSWAPYFHPSGDYLIFSTNLQGFDNFELYLVDVEGESEPFVSPSGRASMVFPSSHPEGRQLLWTSNLTVNQQSPALCYPVG